MTWQVNRQQATTMHTYYMHMTCCTSPCAHVVQASSAATAEDPMLDLSALDVAAVMFDCAEPASFEHAVQLLVGLSSNAGPSLPLLLVAAKDDLGMSSVRAECARILCACLIICNAC